MPDLADVAALLNKNLHKGQLQTIDRLADDVITALGTLKAKLAELPLLSLHFLEATIL